MKVSDYNVVIKNKLFNTKDEYLNVGLWDDTTLDFHNAQINMYMYIFNEANLSDEKQNVLEVGCGTASHYILWKNNGLKANITCFEPFTKTCKDVNNINILRKKADDLVDINKYTRIISIESAFHYQNRERFFKKCYDALKPKGKLIMSDIIINNNYRNNNGLILNMYQSYYRDYILKIPKENAIDIESYKTQLENAGFSKVNVYDVSEKTINKFYELFDKNVIVNALQILKDINNKFCKNLSNKETSIFSYIFVNCEK
jgi:cyclopropane fatty-acyl-phospholipid synthase-like methyltransferase